MDKTQKTLNVSLDQTAAIQCEKCENKIFVEGMLIRKASRFLTGTATDALVPIPVFACSKCGHVNNDFLPPELQTQDAKKPDDI